MTLSTAGTNTIDSLLLYSLTSLSCIHCSWSYSRVNYNQLSITLFSHQSELYPLLVVVLQGQLQSTLYYFILLPVWAVSTARGRTPGSTTINSQLLYSLTSLSCIHCSWSHSTVNYNQLSITLFSHQSELYPLLVVVLHGQLQSTLNYFILLPVWAVSTARGRTPGSTTINSLLLYSLTSLSCIHCSRQGQLQSTLYYFIVSPVWAVSTARGRTPGSTTINSLLLYSLTSLSCIHCSRQGQLQSTLYYFILLPVWAVSTVRGRTPGSTTINSLWLYSLTSLSCIHCSRQGQLQSTLYYFILLPVWAVSTACGRTSGSTTINSLWLYSLTSLSCIHWSYSRVNYNQLSITLFSYQSELYQLSMAGTTTINSLLLYSLTSLSCIHCSWSYSRVNYNQLSITLFSHQSELYPLLVVVLQGQLQSTLYYFILSPVWAVSTVRGRDNYNQLSITLFSYQSELYPLFVVVLQGQLQSTLYDFILSPVWAVSTVRGRDNYNQLSITLFSYQSELYPLLVVVLQGQLQSTLYYFILSPVWAVSTGRTPRSTTINSLLLYSLTSLSCIHCSWSYSRVNYNQLSITLLSHQSELYPLFVVVLQGQLQSTLYYFILSPVWAVSTGRTPRSTTINSLLLYSLTSLSCIHCSWSYSRVNYNQLSITLFSHQSELYPLLVVVLQGQLQSTLYYFILSPVWAVSTGRTPRSTTINSLWLYSLTSLSCIHCSWSYSRVNYNQLSITLLSHQSELYPLFVVVLQGQLQSTLYYFILSPVWAVSTARGRTPGSTTINSLLLYSLTSLSCIHCSRQGQLQSTLYYFILLPVWAVSTVRGRTPGSTTINSLLLYSLTSLSCIHCSWSYSRVNYNQLSITLFSHQSELYPLLMVVLQGQIQSTLYYFILSPVWAVSTARTPGSTTINSLLLYSLTSLSCIHCSWSYSRVNYNQLSITLFSHQSKLYPLLVVVLQGQLQSTLLLYSLTSLSCIHCSWSYSRVNYNQLSITLFSHQSELYPLFVVVLQGQLQSTLYHFILSPVWAVSTARGRTPVSTTINSLLLYSLTSLSCIHCSWSYSRVNYNQLSITLFSYQSELYPLLVVYSRVNYNQLSNTLFSYQSELYPLLVVVLQGQLQSTLYHFILSPVWAVSTVRGRTPGSTTINSLLLYSLTSLSCIHCSWSYSRVNYNQLSITLFSHQSELYQLLVVVLQGQLQSTLYYFILSPVWAVSTACGRTPGSTTINSLSLYSLTSLSCIHCSWSYSRVNYNQLSITLFSHQSELYPLFAAGTTTINSLLLYSLTSLSCIHCSWSYSRVNYNQLSITLFSHQSELYPLFVVVLQGQLQSTLYYFILSPVWAVSTVRGRTPGSTTINSLLLYSLTSLSCINCSWSYSRVNYNQLSITLFSYQSELYPLLVVVLQGQLQSTLYYFILSPVWAVSTVHGRVNYNQLSITLFSHQSELYPLLVVVLQGQLQSTLYYFILLPVWAVSTARGRTPGSRQTPSSTGWVRQPSPGCPPRSYTSGDSKHSHVNRGRKEGNVLFNDALNTFYLRLYGVRYMVKDHSDSERKPAAATT